jgi:hypothetical protein
LIASLLTAAAAHAQEGPVAQPAPETTLPAPDVPPLGAPAEQPAPTPAEIPAPPSAAEAPLDAPAPSEPAPNPVDRETFVGDSFGATPGGIQVGPLGIRFLMQTRWTHTFASPSTNSRVTYRAIEDEEVRDPDGADLQRMFLRFAVDASKYLELKTILDVAELVHDNADNVVKQAYVTVKPIPKHLELTVGLFKLPFSMLELDPIAQWRVADTGEADDLVKDLGFAGKDIGAELMLAPLARSKRLRFAFGAFRGHATDSAKAAVGALGARVESQPIKGLRFGVDWVEHPQQIVDLRASKTGHKSVVPFPADPLYPRALTWLRGRAFSADARYQKHHITLMLEGMLGDRVDYDVSYGAKSFYAVWALAGYRFRVGDMHLMPAVRAEWLDTDRQHPVGLRRELTFALNLDITRSLRFVIDVTRTDVQAYTPLADQPKPWPQIPYFELDNTRVIAQLQAVL